MGTLRRLWHQYNGSKVYDFKEHVQIAQALEDKGCLPSSFMALDPVSHSDLVWDDVTRMRTLNTSQSQRRVMLHQCPLQLDIVDRLIERYSNPGDLVLDPFGGIGSVAYCAVKLGRRGYSIELAPEYHADAISYLHAAEIEAAMHAVCDGRKISVSVTLKVADLFCGAGGTTEGAMQAIHALGRDVEFVAVNHWPVAIATHEANHPNVRHYCKDLDTANPCEIVPEGHLDLLLASPECRFHSPAQGGRPLDEQNRASAWHVVRWAERLYVRRIVVENVPRFIRWGPLGRTTSLPEPGRRTL